MLVEIEYVILEFGKCFLFYRPLIIWLGIPSYVFHQIISTLQRFKEGLRACLSSPQSLQCPADIATAFLKHLKMFGSNVVVVSIEVHTPSLQTAPE